MDEPPRLGVELVDRRDPLPPVWAASASRSQTVTVTSTPKMAPVRNTGNQLPTNPATPGMKISV